jgi:uncharacterized protein (TIGR03437 family)
MKPTNRPLVRLAFQRRFWAPLALLILLGVSTLDQSAQSLVIHAHPQQDVIAPDALWRPLEHAERLVKRVTPQTRAWRLNSAALRQLLARAPLEFQGELSESQVILPLPLPDGSFARFRIEESSLFEPTLAAQFPEIKSYRGQALDVPGMTMRGAWSPLGFNATLLNEGQIINIFPDSQSDNTLYISQANTTQTGQLQCLVNEINPASAEYLRALPPQVAVGNQLRTYRIAIAATWEYASAFGNGTNAGTLASINTWLNGANAVYERELSLRFTLVSGVSVLFTTERGFNAGSDPFNNSNVLALKEQVRTVLRDQVGANNYDLGHVLGGNLGSLSLTNQGVAGLGVVCDNDSINTQTGQLDQLGPVKGSGASIFGANYPLGDSFPLGIWLHEISHQFGAHHTFNGVNGVCSGQRHGPTAYEPGSGTTIMSYVGTCASDNVALDRDMRFHNGSFREILAYISAAGCGTVSNKNNNIPTVNGGADFTIPKQTPFTLTATGSDADAGDQANLTYAWEQADAGETAFPNPPYGDQPNDPPTTTRPLFRTFAATTNPSRTFPSLNYILNNANTPPATINGLQTAEALPRVPRMLNFRVTIRDQRGGVNEDAIKLTVDGSGPFLVTAPNTAVNWTGGTSQTVTWSVNGTNNLAANVRILLSTDGGQTFPRVLSASTPNDGSATITVPLGLSTAQARVKLEAIGNIFFDISDANFSLSPGACTFSISPTMQGFAANGGNGSVMVNAVAPSCGWMAASNANWLQITAGASGTGNGTVNFTVAANTGQTRTGTLTIAGQTFTVTQLAPQPNLANVSAASFFAGELAIESIVAAFGANLATATQVARTLPLPTELAGTRVLVKDSAGNERAAALFFVSSGQVNYQIPPGTVAGLAQVTVRNANGASVIGNIIVTQVAPGVFAANSNGRDVPAGVLVRVRGTTQQFEPLLRLDTTTNRYVAIPIDLGPTTDIVVVVLFGTGWRRRSSLDEVEVRIGNDVSLVDAPVAFAGAAPNFVGLDQMNFTLPRSLAGRGVVEVRIKVDGKAANIVRLNIK